ncbi:TRAP transporter small permease subunit [Azospirillum sp. TSO35-2]|uniref:TRAP transporter small permease n=1 Tax=Azospirillum sp. TSO35-2 TaxID=716796 RepID=UPI000D60C423|nr:TRAP transporter small permease subunit [Azospirillum sp. TSO35-2]PWC32790.1 C4-dicarboxylate ABC transporter [Azospirillum sp. TSO35-2]
MRNAIAAVVSAAATLCRWGTLAATGVLILVVTLQVLGRIPGMPSPPWTEEVARFALVHLVAFSCGLALLRGELVNVDMFTSLLPVPMQTAVARLVDLIILVFAVAIIPGSWDYVVGSLGERARSIDVPMIWVYAVTLIIPVSLAFFAIARLAGLGREQQSPSHGEMV